MAGYGADLDETPRWRLSILFLVVVFLSLVGHIGLHCLEEYFKKHKRTGLKHTLQSLKDELFALGLITLLLITLQDQIVKLCIDGGDDTYSQGYPTTNRKLLAGTGDSFKCPEGKEQFWSITALHEIHILIFLIAIVHLVQAAISMVLASFRVRRWKKYEDRSRHDMVPLKRRRAIKTKGSWAALWIQSFLAQFSDSVDGPVYLAIRRIFLEKMELDDDFNFYAYVVDSMEEDFAKLVEFQWMMWLIAAIYILLPWEAYTIIWLPCLFLIIMLIVGAKLQAVAIQLATLAYTHYTPNFIPHKERKNKAAGLISKSKKKFMSMLSKTSQYPTSHHKGKEKKSTNEECSEVESSKNSNQGSSVEMTSPPRLGTISVLPHDIESGMESEMESGPSQQQLEKFDKNAGEMSWREREGKVEQAAASKAEKQNKSSVAEHMAQTKLLSDSSSLFWFSKPKIILHIFQYVYFQSGLMIALLILDEWRGQQVNHLTGHVLYVLMIGVNLIVMVHAALFVIPTYAITVAAGAYGPDNVLRKALKRNVSPKLAKRLDLERKSFVSTHDSEDGSLEIGIDTDQNETDGYESEHVSHGHGHGSNGDDARLKMLLEAMDHSQVRKQKMAETDAKFAEEGIGHYFRSASKIEPIFAEDDVEVAVPKH
eukprot:TRINITY_DN12554_c0_g1_i11.p1 TRINITY_DN12554_c0_g1~~TRINITY_DN12554_c0_g1_i11.p1  ORF type:complete len:653 (-),score=135.65 TRINITY_DN12554_c0_g1_i11:726-2684(-)